MRKARWFFVGLVCVGLGLPEGMASAAPTPAQEAAAGKLFDAAVAEVQAGRYAEACPLLEQSHVLDPKPGTLHALAECEVKIQKLDQALAHYREYLALYAAMKSPLREKHTERARVAEEQEKKLLAEILFNRAVAHRAAGRHAEACAALAESQRIDPTPGTLYALAECEATRGRMATALGHYTTYLGLFAAMKSPLRERHAERARIAEEQRKKLDAETPRLKLVWAGEVPEGVVVSRGNTTFDLKTLGASVPMDPGEYAFRVEVPGRPPQDRNVRLEKGDRKILELTPGATQEAKDERQPLPEQPLPPPPQPIAPSKPEMHPWAIGGIAAMGLGGAALIAGSVLGGLAMAEKREVDAVCDANFACGVEGMKTVERFWALGNASTATFIVGGVVLATGVTLFVLSPKPTAEKVGSVRVRGLAGPGAGYLGVDGTF
ncbi:tetratricopeptide repeat protein [Polyangium jinanense]|uniref:Tetratricopeptide repeat protein n=1 Tax=Polyangium jinanense TaxID=2829994 RepID=A0A9X3XHI0_9BACT|nr:tetratricopeptide repeat protein [Polyangium jinanense]MDC3962057.1 tetratricopeptide repeat protein [Polyangium jinanense]MDC3988773.1 tetratricopeptide repeat protein [Polyangium jinanense]